MRPLEQQVRQFVLDNFLFGEERDLKSSSSLLEAGIIDSTGVLELVTFLEKSFGIQVADSELVPENLDSIDRIASYIERKQGNAEGARAGAGV